MGSSKILAHLCIGLCIAYSSAIQAEKLKLAANTSSAPFVYMDGEGKYSGFEVDLMNEVGKLQGFTIEVIPAKFPDVFNQLENKEIDLIGNAYYSEARAEKYLFTIPHYKEEFVFINVMNNNKDDMEQLSTEPLRISVLEDSPLQTKLEEISAEYQNIKIVPLLTGFLGFKSLFQKKADLMFSVHSEARFYTGNHKEHQYKIFPVPEKYQEKIDIAFLATKENTALINRINAGLEELKSNGVYSQLKQKYNLE